MVVMNKAFQLGFEHVAEEISVDSLPVKGHIPEWLQGTLLRNGPGTFRVGDQQYRHWFDGLAMLHKFSFAGGRVSYVNKYLESRAYDEAMAGGRIAYSEFATDPCRSLFERVSSVFSPKVTDSAKVSIAKIADRFMALAETPIQVQFDPETLKSVGVFNYEERLTGQMTTVHPHFDHGRGEVYNVVTRYHRVSHYKTYKMVDGGGPVLVSSVPVSKPAYMHSFGMSENYIILTEFPLVVNPISLLLWLKPYIENFKWEPRRGTSFWIINRHNGEVVGRYEADPFFAFHHINAFERGDELIVDLAAYADASIIDAFYLNRLRDMDLELPHGNLRRYRVPLKGGRVTHEVISNACMELPHFDYGRYNMNGDYRYVYAVGVNPAQPNGFYNQLVKVDIETGQNQAWHQDGCYPGEPIFVGAPGRVKEDGGVILSVVLDAANSNSFLLVLDAASFTELGRAEIRQPVLFGYHGAYFGAN
jgi:carotenoid cleavage dioxygenase-like enzyme